MAEAGSSNNEAALESLSTEDAIILVRVRLISSQRVYIWLTNFVVTSFTAFLFWQESNSSTVLWWCLVQYLLPILRYLDIRRFHRGGEKSVAQHRRFLYGVGMFAFALGCTWGAAALLFLDIAQPFLFMFLVITMAGVALGGLPALTVYLPAYVSFAVPMVVGVCLSLVAQDNSMATLLAALTAAFGFVILAFARSIANATTTSITMENEMAELYQEVSAAKDRIEEISADKSRFLAAISHDVSQPLYSMMLYLQTLKNKTLSADQSQLLDKLESSTHSLHEMFNSMLEVARLEQGAVDSHETSFPLARILKNLEDELRVQTEQKQLDFQIDTNTNAIVLSDSVLLARILRNLLSNAIKYTETGFVRVSVEEENGDVLIRVQDSGPGIAAAEQENIFQEYQQINNPERNYAQGLGLGLSVVTKLVALLEHELILASSPGEGATFTLRVKHGSHHDAGVEAANAQNQWDDIAGLHIIVLEDDASVREGLSALLLSWGCEVTVEEDVDKLIEAASRKTRPPDLLLSDYRLPGDYDGIAATQRVRDNIDPQLPCIIVSGDAHEEVVSRAREHGLSFLAKPVAPEELRVTIAESV